MKQLEESELALTMGGLGLLETIVGAVVVLTATNIVNNWDDFKAGLSGLPDPSKKVHAK